MKNNKEKIEDQDYREREQEQQGNAPDDFSGKEKKAAGPRPDKKDKKHKTDKKTEELEQRFEELNDKFLRLYSEYENYRRRTLKEKLELSKTATGEVIIDLLPVLDDFERALKAFEGHTDPGSENLREGVLLIFNKMKTLLEKKGLEEITAMGEPFDTEFHDAITNIPAPSEDMKGKVLDVVEKGYMLNGKVIRYARVVVGN